MAWFGSMCRWGDGVGISCKAELQFHIPNSFLQLVLFDTLFFHVSLFSNASLWQWAKVNGVWSWQAVHAAGGVHVKLPYDCHAGLKNWHIGWSAPKKAWKGCGNDFRAFVCCINIEFATLPLVFCVGLHRPGAAATISWAVKVEQAQMLMPWHFGQKLGH